MLQTFCAFLFINYVIISDIEEGDGGGGGARGRDDEGEGEGLFF